MKALLIGVLGLSMLTLHAEDWTTTDGKSYKDIKVIRVEDDAVTILCRDGGALVPIFKLPASLQQRFSYDPMKAKVAANARAKADAENARQLQAEMELSARMKLAGQIQDAKAKDKATGNP